MLPGSMDHMFRLFSALASDPFRQPDGDDDDDSAIALQALQGHGNGHMSMALAGSGVHAARRLRGQPGRPVPGDGGTMFVVSMPDRGMLGAPFSMPGLMHGDDAFMMPLGSRATHEVMMQNAMGTAMQAMMEHIAQSVVERSMQEQQMHPTVPPASESCRDALPRVVVTKEDLIDATNSNCSICLEQYKAGIRATRMFCGHLFCTNCIREWLRTANSCPVCRFELPTNTVDYEEGRTQRMRERVARFKEGELRAMRVPDLRRVMVALGVSGEGCVEKGELIARLGTAPGVEVTPDRKDIFYEDSDLNSLDLPLLRSLAERHRVPPLAQCSSSASSTAAAAGSGDNTEEEERAEVLQRFAASGLMGVDKAAQLATENVPAAESPKGDDVGQPPVPPPPPSPPPAVTSPSGQPQTEAALPTGNNEVDEPEVPPSPPDSPPNCASLLPAVAEVPPPPAEPLVAPAATTAEVKPKSPRKSSKASGSSPRRQPTSGRQASSASPSESASAAAQSEHRSSSSMPSRPSVPSPGVTRPRVKPRASNGAAAAGDS